MNIASFQNKIESLKSIYFYCISMIKLKSTENSLKGIFNLPLFV